MASPKDKPQSAPKPAEKISVPGPASLVEANAAVKRRRQAEIAKRNACIEEMLKPYVEMYGPKKIKQVRGYLASVIDGKRLPHEKKVPLRIPPDGNLGAYNGKTTAKPGLV